MIISSRSFHDINRNEEFPSYHVERRLLTSEEKMCLGEEISMNNDILTTYYSNYSHKSDSLKQRW